MKILIIKYGALGDIIMATALIRQVLEQANGAGVWLLTEPAYSPLFADWPGLNVQPFPRRGTGSLWQTLRWIRGQSFDRLLDLQSSDRSGVLAALSGIPDRAGNHPRFPYHRHPLGRYTGQCHARERHNQVLAAAGIPPATGPPLLPAPPTACARTREWLSEQGLGRDRLVLLHAGSSQRHPEKRWPGFSRLATELSRHGYRPVWVGGEEDRDLNRALATEHGTDATGAFSILELAELGRRAEFAVTNDSAPMHVLSCSGIPVYGLFGPSDWRRTHAIGQADNVITAGDDLTGLSVETVLGRLQQDGRLDAP